MITKEEIEERKAASLERIKVRRSKFQEFRNKVKEGNKYFQEIKDQCYCYRVEVSGAGFSSEMVSLTIILRHFNFKHTYAFSCCSHKDTYSVNIGRGLAAYRLLKDPIPAYPDPGNIEQGYPFFLLTRLIEGHFLALKYPGHYFRLSARAIEGLCCKKKSTTGIYIKEL